MPGLRANWIRLVLAKVVCLECQPSLMYSEVCNSTIDDGCNVIPAGRVVKCLS